MAVHSVDKNSEILIFNHMVKYKTDDLDVVFSALADSTRRAILDKLSAGPASVGQLAEPFSISFAAVSKHLGVLSAAGLIEMKKEGRTHWMHLRAGALKNATDWLDQHEKFWKERLDALDHLLASPKRSK